MNARIEAATTVTTRTGTYRLYVFSNDRDDVEHVAIVYGRVWGASDVPVRIHSGSLRCSCCEQLADALDRVAELPRGVVLYLRQRESDDGDRDYGAAFAMLKTLGVRSVKLLAATSHHLVDSTAVGEGT